ncbi:MAG: hypothetical protein ABI821_11490 [Pseudomonadota bacterium]
MRTIYVAVLAFTMSITVARADSGILVGHVPNGADPAIVVAVVKQALINREWTVKAAEANYVVAVIDAGDTDAQIRIELSRGRLLYDGTATRTMRPTGPQQQMIVRKGDVPKRWIEYLRRDISAILATMPEH